MPSHPNIVFITTHDTGRHFGCYGIPTVHTPYIDRLAGEGVLLEQLRRDYRDWLRRHHPTVLQP